MLRGGRGLGWDLDFDIVVVVALLLWLVEEVRRWS